MQRLLLGSTATAFGVVATGDLLAQAVREPSIDPRRCLVPATYSGLLAPMYVVFWSWLDVRYPGQSLAMVMRKAMANQLVTSLPNNVGYMAFCSYWIGGDGPPLRERLRTEMPAIIATAFSFWLPMNALNFAFVPVRQRILFMSVANCAWAGWLSDAVNGGRRAAGALDCAAEAAAPSAGAAVSGISPLATATGPL